MRHICELWDWAIRVSSQSSAARGKGARDAPYDRWPPELSQYRWLPLEICPPSVLCEPVLPQESATDGWDLSSLLSREGDKAATRGVISDNLLSHLEAGTHRLQRHMSPTTWTRGTRTVDRLSKRHGISDHGVTNTKLGGLISCFSLWTFHIYN